jgi:hypothetical protein
MLKRTLHGYALILISAATGAALGCGNESPGFQESSGSAIGAWASADSGGGMSRPPVFAGIDGGGGDSRAAPSSTCTETGDAATLELAFSTALPCAAKNRACPAGSLSLAVTTGPAPSGGISTTWTVHNGSTLVLSRTTRVDGSVTFTTIELETPDQGTASAIFSDDGKSLTGSIDGRPFLPVALAGGVVQSAIAFGDGLAAPSVHLPAETAAGIEGLLGIAKTDAPLCCPGGQATAGAIAAAIARLVGLLPPAFTGGDPGAAPSTTVPSSATSDAITVPVPSTVSQATITYAPEGVAPDFSGASSPNTLDDVETPACQQCAHDCANSGLLNVITLGSYGDFCYFDCFYPTNGCGQKYCDLIHSCDNDEQCCGSVCCGPGTVCGDSSESTCCPSDAPVGCGDVTGVTCFVSGSSCCGTLDTACGPGQECTNVTATLAQCCAPANATTGGTCCDQPTCGGECCDQGSCVMGVCCFGPVNSLGQCCPGGLTQTTCNGECCTGMCTSNGSCCATGSTVCGSACCTTSQACLDSATSTCGPPPHPRLLLEEDGISVPDAIEGSTYQIVGQAFVAGPVTVTLTPPGGTTETLGTVTASASGTFTLNHIFQPAEGGADQIVATEGTLRATLTVVATPLP